MCPLTVRERVFIMVLRGGSLLKNGPEYSYPHINTQLAWFALPHFVLYLCFIFILLFCVQLRIKSYSRLIEISAVNVG